MTNLFKQVGEYSLLMKRVFNKPDSWKMFFRQLPKELEKLGLQSLPIVVIISTNVAVAETNIDPIMILKVSLHTP